MKPEEMEKRALEAIENADRLAAEVDKIMDQAKAQQGGIGRDMVVDPATQALVHNAKTSALNTLAQVRQYMVLNSAVELALKFGKDE
jgi:hypothetical protein